MAKLVLTDLDNFTNETSVLNSINGNNALIETALENTLSRDGSSPNTMSSNLDMNSYRIVNLVAASNNTEPVRKAEFDAAVLAAASALTSNSVAGGVVWSSSGSNLYGKLYASGANKFLYSTASDTFAEGGITAAGRALINSTVTADGSGNVSGVDTLTISGNAGIGTPPLASKLTLANNVYTAPFGASYSQYQILLYDGGSAAPSYGIGVEPFNIGFNSSGGYKFYQMGGSIPLMIVGGASGNLNTSFSGGIQVKSSASPYPSAGKGVEITYPSGSDTGYILSYDRDGSAFKPLGLDSSALTLNQSVGGPIYCKGQFGFAEYTVGTAPSPAGDNLFILVTDLDTTTSGTAISGHGGGSNKRLCIASGGAWYVY